MPSKYTWSVLPPSAEYFLWVVSPSALCKAHRKEFRLAAASALMQGTVAAANIGPT